MRRRLFIVNVVLFAAIALMGTWFYKVWVRPLDLPVSTDRLQTAVEDEQPDKKRERPLDILSYNVISEKDLFRPSRTAVKVSDTALSTGIISQDTPKLFGTIIKSDKKFAILEDPITKTSKIYTVNDSVAGYIINDIQRDKVVLLRGSEPVEVKLREAKTFKAPVQRRQPVVNRPAPNRRQPSVRRTIRRPGVRRTPAQPPDVEGQPGQPGVEIPENLKPDDERHPFEAR